MTAIAIPRQPNSLLDRLRTIQLGLGARGAVGAGLARQRGGAAAGNGLLNALVAYWPLNEAAGANNALDLHTNGLTLTQTASPGSAAGVVYAGARTFNGSTQYFSRASEALLQTGDVDFTIAAWAQISSIATYAGLISKFLPAGNLRCYELQFFAETTNRFRFVVSSDGTEATETKVEWSSSPSLNTWYFLLSYHDALNDKIGISINNGTDVTKATSSGMAVLASNFALGSRTAGAIKWPGRIGPVAFWKSAAGGGGVLSAAQRTALWNNGDGLPYASFTA